MDWKDIVEDVAPALASAFGTPAAGIAVKVLADSVLGSSTGNQATDETNLQTALSGGLTPDLQAKIIDAQSALKEQAFELQKSQLANDVAEYTSDAADRDSARKANVAGQQATRVFWFAVLIFLGVVGIEGGVLMLGLPKTGEPELMGRILGTLDSALMAAVFYIFGSSASSARKDELQANGSK
jgi:hypothetical protein